MTDARLGLTVVHRRYVPYSHAHYAGDLVDGAYLLALFGDVATEVCIRTDGDEGLFASYRDVQFHAPVRAGDVLEVVAEVIRVGTRARDLRLVARVVCRGRPDLSPSAAEVLDPPRDVVSAHGTVVVPLPVGRSRQVPTEAVTGAADVRDVPDAGGAETVGSPPPPITPS